MKVKTLVAMVASSLLAVSVCYAADDVPVDNNSQNAMSPTANPGAMSGMSGSGVSPAPADTVPSSNGSGDTTNNGSMGNSGADEGTSDTATGSSDDASDY